MIQIDRPLIFFQNQVGLFFELWLMVTAKTTCFACDYFEQSGLGTCRCGQRPQFRDLALHEHGILEGCGLADYELFLTNLCVNGKGLQMKGTWSPGLASKNLYI